jgi:hypothetical protein
MLNSPSLAEKTYLPEFLSNADLINSISNISKDIYKQYPELESINKKTIDLLQRGVSPNEIQNILPEKDIASLNNIYKEIDNSVISSTSELEENIRKFLNEKGYPETYIKDLESDVEEYQKHYKMFGTFPENESKKAEVMSTTYDPVLLSMGYTVTTAVLTQQLATLGTICATAFPYIALIALLAGVTILVAVIIYDYCENYSDINDQIIDWYGTSAESRVLNASSSTRDLVLYRTLYGIKYWEAYLVNFAGLGGLAVGSPLSQGAAVSRLRCNSMHLNTYAVLYTDAFEAAAVAGGNTPYYNSAHTSDGKILNKPHYHPVRPNNQRCDSHSFFGL